MNHGLNWLHALRRLVLVLGLAAPIVAGTGRTRAVLAHTAAAAPVAESVGARPPTTSLAAGAALQPAFPLTTTQYTLTDLGTLGGAASYAFALNEIGQVVGGSDIAGGPTYAHAFMWQAGVMTD